MMSPELIGAVVAGGGSLLAAWNGSQGRQIRQLRREVNGHAVWRATATQYIGTLLFVMASHGVTPPPTPPGLGLSEARAATADPPA